MRPAALVFFLLVSRAQALPSEAEGVRSAAFESYLRGSFDSAADAYRRLITLLPSDAEPATDLALALRDAGRPQDAAAHWLKASLMAPGDAFIWNQRGWNYLAISRYKEARDCFQAAVRLSSAAPSSAEAYLGLGLAGSLDGSAKTAFPALQQTVTRSPYLLPAAAAELGRLTMGMGRSPQAVPFLTMSLGQDQLQPDVARDLAQSYEKMGHTRAAWQAYKFVLDLDPGDSEAKAKEEKLSHFIPGRPVDSMPLRRLARPLLREPKPEPPSPPLRVGLLSDASGRLSHVTHLYFMTSSDFRLADVKLGTIDGGKPNSQWEVIFRVDNRVVEVRDAFNNIHYVTKQPFRIEPQEGGTTLLKNPELSDIQGLDIGDRELRGSVEIIPTPMGFHIVNELGVDEYLFSVIGQALPQDSPSEAYKSMAVLMRSRALEMKRTAAANPERTDLCDSSRCVPYLGLTEESRVAVQGVRQTRGVTLAPGHELPYHSSCGWATQEGVQDRAAPQAPPRSAADIERLVHGYPPEGYYDDASARVPANWLRWLRVVDGAQLRERMNRIKPLGPIRSVRVTRRGPAGRVAALEVSGPGGTVPLEGDAAIAAFLTPSLRSSLFTLQPIYNGRDIERLMIWGAGTGHGRGFCVAGAVGQAHLGKNFKEILDHYFPQVKIEGLPPEPPARPKLKKAPTHAPDGAARHRRHRRPPVRHFAAESVSPPQASSETAKPK